MDRNHMFLCKMMVVSAVVIGIMMGGMGTALAEKKVGVLIFSGEKRYQDARDGALAQLKKDGFSEPAVKFTMENAESNKAKAAEISKKMAEAKYDLILVVGTTAAVALANQVKDVPVVFTMVYDPVDSKIAKEWKSSGNNTTGTSPHVSMAKLLEYLKKIAPVKAIGVLYTPGERNSETQLKEIQAEQKASGIKVVPVPVANKNELVPVVTDVTTKIEALFLTGAAVVGDQLPAIVEIADKNKVITASHLEDFVDRGVMMGLTADPSALGRLAGEKAAKILKGAEPSSLPIEALDKLDLILNLKTASKAGIIIPADIKKTATRVIE
jgi:putative ABC transport system substrate-binding protein